MKVAPLSFFKAYFTENLGALVSFEKNFCHEEDVYVTIGSPGFCLLLYLTGVYFRGELQHVVDVSEQKIKCWPIGTRETGGVRLSDGLYVNSKNHLIHNFCLKFLFLKFQFVFALQYLDCYCTKYQVKPAYLNLKLPLNPTFFSVFLVFLER